jgi:hypothetical protein
LRRDVGELRADRFASAASFEASASVTSARLLSIHELKGMPAPKAPHLLESFDWDEGGQWLPFRSMMNSSCRRQPVQHVANSMTDVHCGKSVRH